MEKMPKKHVKSFLRENIGVSHWSTFMRLLRKKAPSACMDCLVDQDVLNDVKCEECGS